MLHKSELITSRAEKIIELIDYLDQFDAGELAHMSQDSNAHNQDHIVSGKFYSQCQQYNNKTIEEIFKSIH